jgi:hypothetical protein
MFSAARFANKNEFLSKQQAQNLEAEFIAT